MSSDIISSAMDKIIGSTSASGSQAKEGKKQLKEFAIVAVAFGEGIKNTFLDMIVDI